MRAVPDTHTFNLRDVVAVIDPTGIKNINSLRAAFANSIDLAFDPRYGHTSGMTTGLKLDMFRNYRIIEVGDMWGGGIVFQAYDIPIGSTPSSQNLLIISTFDLVRGIQWKNTVGTLTIFNYPNIGSNLSLFYPQETNLGTDASGYWVSLYTNYSATTTIINAQGSGSYAAKICRDSMIGGFDNWSLPSFGELKYLQSVALNIESRNPGFIATFDGSSTAKYWSCSEAGRMTGSGLFVEHTFDSALAVKMMTDSISDTNTNYDINFAHIQNRSNLFNVRPVRQSLTGYFA